MFRTDKSAKYAILGLMGIFLIGVPFLYLQGSYGDVVLIFGLELIFYWAFLNPWIMQEKYRLFFFVDTSKMTNNTFLIVGALFVIGSIFMIL